MRYSSSSSASKSAILDKNTTQYKALTVKLFHYSSEIIEIKKYDDYFSLFRVAS